MAGVDGEIAAAAGESAEGTAAPPSAASATADPAVSLAFAAGWQMARLYRRSTPKGGEEVEAGSRLPGIGNLGPARRTELALLQVKAALGALRERLAVGGLAPPSTQRVEEAHEGGSRGELHLRISQLHVELLQGLTAGDFRLGKAYSLGRALADTCGTPRSLDELQGAFRYHRISGLQEFLTDLDSLFPRHAGRAVSLSLDIWRDWAADPRYGDGFVDWAEHAAPVKQSLVRQGHLWRALLSGEKASTDMLGVDDYLEAADRLFDRGARLVWSVSRRYWPGLLLAALVLVGAVVLTVLSNDAAGIVAAVAAAAAALGVTWKGVGSALATVGGRLQAPLWGVELDYAVAAAITRLPGTEVVAGQRDVEVLPSGPLKATLPEARASDVARG